MSEDPESEAFALPEETHPDRFGELFLHRLDGFPEGPTGEPWGKSPLTIDFAGGPYRFDGLSASQHRELSERFGELVLAPECSQHGADLDHTTPIRVFRVSRRGFKDFDVRGWSYTFDRDYQQRAVRVAGLHFVARIDFEPTLTAALWTPYGEGPVFVSQMENFFRLLVAYRLLHLGGVLFHSAAVASRGQGFLFLGHSGAGKTTISKLSLATGRSVLSDDMNALCPSDQHADGLSLEKLPFAGDLGRTPTARQRYPVAGVYRLKKGPDRIDPVRKSQAVAFLIGCAPFVNVDPHRVDRLTDNLIRLLDQHPLKQLTFSKQGRFWSLLEGPNSQ